MKVAFPKPVLVILLCLLLAGCDPRPITSQAAPGQYTASQEDLHSIQQTALDYIEGWYDGEAARMERSLHPDLVKRVILPDQMLTVGMQDMVEMTQSGAGKAYSGEIKNVVTILDFYYDIATVKVESAEYMDFLHIGKVNGDWIIINILWTGKKDIGQE